MLTNTPLVLFLAVVSAVSKDYFNQDRLFGLPAQTAFDGVTAQEESSSSFDVDIVGGRAPSNVEEHLKLGQDEDIAFFRQFWELLFPKTGISSESSWDALETSLLKDYNLEYSSLPEIKLEKQVFPDIEIVKYELPPLLELPAFNLPPLPDIKLPDLKVLKYELPALPELKPIELPQLPEFKLPDVKILKYELPPLPDLKFPELPQLKPLELPDINIMKYELPPLPELKFPELPQLKPLELPDINIIKYELPALEFKPLDIPPLPEINLPDWKIVKYELPPFPTMKPLDLPPLPDLQLPGLKIIKYELPSLPDVKPLKFNHWTSHNERVTPIEILDSGSIIQDVAPRKQISFGKEFLLPEVLEEQISSFIKEEPGKVVSASNDQLVSVTTTKAAHLEDELSRVVGTETEPEVSIVSDEPSQAPLLS